ncbi:PE-PGRS family protein [Strigomonas culicis]|uniref:PE-PGRS family protein n=1 Tax=Strigomonas culicis TaxID=28005 RepID=S9UQB9_9TRYP|nr:PE-PGRS family protein [Strigomonas culicis]|eukprot:EPY16841.1 PE-PGRS family protein [Strigomonas culicis]
MSSSRSRAHLQQPGGAAHGDAAPARRVRHLEPVRRSAAQRPPSLRGGRGALRGRTPHATKGGGAVGGGRPRARQDRGRHHHHLHRLQRRARDGGGHLRHRGGQRHVRAPVRVHLRVRGLPVPLACAGARHRRDPADRLGQGADEGHAAAPRAPAAALRGGVQLLHHTARAARHRLHGQAHEPHRLLRLLRPRARGGRRAALCAAASGAAQVRRRPHARARRAAGREDVHDALQRGGQPRAAVPRPAGAAAGAALHDEVPQRLQVGELPDAQVHLRLLRLLLSHPSVLSADLRRPAPGDHGAAAGRAGSDGVRAAVHPRRAHLHLPEAGQRRSGRHAPH